MGHARFKPPQPPEMISPDVTFAYVLQGGQEWRSPTYCKGRRDVRLPIAGGPLASKNFVNPDPINGIEQEDSMTLNELARQAGLSFADIEVLTGGAITEAML
jgi:hypothetical protein